MTIAPINSFKMKMTFAITFIAKERRSFFWFYPLNKSSKIRFKEQVKMTFNF